jgi:ceramide glucosyltransferase
VDLKSPRDWWGHLVYWDQNNGAARPGALFSTILLRAVPFACLLALLRLGDPLGWIVLGGTVIVRLMTMGIVMGTCLKDREGLASLWMLPFRDLAALASWALALTKRTTIWRGTTFRLTRDGRLVAMVSSARQARPGRAYDGV